MIGFPRTIYVYKGTIIDLDRAVEMVLAYGAPEKLHREWYGAGSEKVEDTLHQLESYRENSNLDYVEEVLTDFNGDEFVIGGHSYIFVVPPHDNGISFFIGMRWMKVPAIGSGTKMVTIPVASDETMQVDLGGDIGLYAISNDCTCCS
jgi:hypothetical protein